MHNTALDGTDGASRSELDGMKTTGFRTFCHTVSNTSHARCDVAMRGELPHGRDESGLRRITGTNTDVIVSARGCM